MTKIIIKKTLIKMKGKKPMRVTMGYLNRLIKNMWIIETIPKWFKQKLIEYFGDGYVLADDGHIYEYTDEDICYQTISLIAEYINKSKHEKEKNRTLLGLKPWE